ncbi:MAG: protein kinase [Blastocatellia bacterium]|nr:protein kinase [Blastocatellia bacterium]
MNIDKIDPIVGRTLGDFLVKEKLGEGGFGAVYKATQLTLEREAVIKVLHTRHRTNKSVIKRFKREARLASSLEHPYCAHIYSFGAESDGLLWIAMEMVAGTPLNEILKSQGSLSLEKFVPLLDKICEVVHTAHEAGIIHRDLKPANVMIISRAGRLLPKLLDFGIAKDLHQNSPEEKIGFIDKSPKYRDSKETNKINSQKTITNDHFVVKTDALNDKNTVVDNDNLIDQETIIKSNGLRNQETIIENNNLIDQETTISNENIDIEDFLKLGQIANNKKPVIELKINKNSINIETLKTHGVIGTPSYMPPEQWENGANADARSDIYSLGILAYQAITGTVPFKEKGFELYGAHLSKPVPPLKSSFPSKLNDVLQKALSKRVEDRYQTALEFAKNFHQAANFDEEKANLPQFDEIVKENLLTNAPKPIAESVASLLASHNAYKFKDRVLLVFRVLIRYIGILSIASYTSIADKIQNNELINKSISALYQETLNEAQWIELSRELCRSFAKKRDALLLLNLYHFFC